MRSPVAIALVTLGAILLLAGLLIEAGWLGWFGRLPGDIRIEREGLRIYFPLASMVLVSAALTLIVAFLRRFR
jgi:membrane protein implicated in regulation of membrane protease activity